MNSGAEFSECKKYRYLLWRIWDESKPLIAFCMLNPSTANEKENDPTVERCQRRAEQMGFGGLYVINAFAYRSTDPKKLKKVKDPVGDQNNFCIADVAQSCYIVICGWGKHASLNGRGKEVSDLIDYWGGNAHALKLNKDGSPAHPLYIGYDVKPFDIKTGKCFNGIEV